MFQAANSSNIQWKIDTVDIENSNTVVTVGSLINAAKTRNSDTTKTEQSYIQASNDLLLRNTYELLHIYLHSSYRLLGIL